MKSTILIYGTIKIHEITNGKIGSKTEINNVLTQNKGSAPKWIKKIKLIGSTNNNDNAPNQINNTANLLKKIVFCFTGNLKKISL
jgi:hypothetical protein